MGPAGHDRIWPDRIWPNMVLWPCLVKYVLAFGWCSSVLWLLCKVFLGMFNIFGVQQFCWACSTFLLPGPFPPDPPPPPGPTTFFVLSSLSWGSSRGMLMVFWKRRDPQMCTFGVLAVV